MYHDFYHLSLPPFENTPDPRFFYASEQHREALAAIEYTIRMRKGFVLITGDIGSGKTTVGRTMCERFADRALIVPVLHGHPDGDSLLRQILRALGVHARRSDDHALQLERLRDRLTEQIGLGKPVVLLVDEAQTLSDPALEELRLLSNFDTATAKLIQIVLIGQPELLRQRLCVPALAALRQRFILAKQLQPLSPAETAAYIEHRLREASADKANPGVRFTPEALAKVHRHAGGVPRLINVLCDNVMLLAFVRQAREVTAAMVQQAAQDMMPEVVETRFTVPRARAA